MVDELDISMEHWWNDSNKGKLKYSEKPVPVPLSTRKRHFVLQYKALQPKLFPSLPKTAYQKILFTQCR